MLLPPIAQKYEGILTKSVLYFFKGLVLPGVCRYSIRRNDISMWNNMDSHVIFFSCQTQQTLPLLPHPPLAPLQSRQTLSFPLPIWQPRLRAELRRLPRLF